MAHDFTSPFYSPVPDADAWPHGEMVDMARTPEEIKQQVEAMQAPVVAKVPEYPWGLSITLDNDALRKLSLDGQLPSVGDVLEFYATARVTCAKSIEKVDPGSGEPDACECVELQITHMLVNEEEPEDVDTAEIAEAMSRGRRQRFYGGDGDSMREYDDDFDD